MEEKEKVSRFARFLPLLIGFAFCLSADLAAAEPRKVMNIVNFVRGCEPRMKVDLVKPLAEEIWFNSHYGFKNTILMQYDAMLDEELVRTALSADRTKTEYGVWFEVVRPLCEKVGIPWRSKRGWDWDWHIVPGFSMAYTLRERELLADELMRLATEKFGRTPESVGSWLIDAHTMEYLSEKYGVKAFCICREQDNTDAYGLRGGYANGAYYPSRVNMLSAARDMTNAIRTPVFKMLTPDPIYNYNKATEMFGEYPFELAPSTMEPVGPTGYIPSVVDWYFRVYAKPTAMLNLSYMQTGQENSFGWPLISLGLSYQMRAIAENAKENGLIVETLAETGARFMSDHPSNCPQTQIALEDWTGHGRQSVWFNSRCYRLNLLLDGRRLSIRDFHQMLDDYQEPCFNVPCTDWQLQYYTPPIVDQFLDRGEQVKGDMEVLGEFSGLDATTPDETSLCVTAMRTDGRTVRFELTETSVRITGGALAWRVRPERRGEIAVADDRIALVFHGYRHSVGLTAETKSCAGGWQIAPKDGVIVFKP